MGLGETDARQLLATLQPGQPVLVAMTFMDVAATTGVEKTARRNHENARRAYDTIVRLLRNLGLTAEQRQILDEKLSALKTRLQAVGQQF